MNPFTKALLVLVAIPLCAFMWWKTNYLTGTWNLTGAWNQKLTLTVSTPRGEVSGYSVVAVSWTRDSVSGGSSGALFHVALRGDATAVDLGGGQYLFAGYDLSNEPQCTGYIALKLLRQKLPGRSDDDYGASDTFKRVQAAKGRGPITLPKQLYPNFLRFRDIKGPTTAEPVDPDDLAQSFGPGVRLVRVTMEITDEAVTRTTENLLPWLPPAKLRFFHHRPFGPYNLSDLDTPGSSCSTPADARKGIRP